MLTNENISVLLVGPSDRMTPVRAALDDNTRIYPDQVEDLDAARDRLGEQSYDCVVADIDDAVELFRTVFDRHPETGRIVYTDLDREEVTRELIEADGLEISVDAVVYGAQLAFGYVNSGDEDALDRLERLIMAAHDANLFAPYPTQDESSRLQAVEQYAPEPDPDYDALTELARQIFDVERASIRVIGRDEQRYVSTQGFSSEPVDRSETICTYTILEDDSMVVEDVRDDPRFSDFDWLDEEGIAAYAGAVIRLDDQPIATFCLEHGSTRSFTPEERRILEQLADIAGRMIALKHRLAVAQDT